MQKPETMTTIRIETVTSPDVCKLLLVGKSKKGRERIKQHGSVWTVDTQVPVVAGRLLVWPDNQKDWRWVSVRNDPDFVIEAAFGTTEAIRHFQTIKKGS